MNKDWLGKVEREERVRENSPVSDLGGLMGRFKGGYEFSDLGRKVGGDSAVNRVGSIGLTAGFQGPLARAVRDRWTLVHFGRDRKEWVRAAECRKAVWGGHRDRSSPEYRWQGEPYMETGREYEV